MVPVPTETPEASEGEPQLTAPPSCDGKAYTKARPARRAPAVLPEQIKLLIREPEVHRVGNRAGLLTRNVRFFVPVDAPSEARVLAVNFHFELLITDEQEGHTVFIMKRAHQLKTRLVQAVRFVNDDQRRMVRKPASDLDVELVIREVF